MGCVGEGGVAEEGAGEPGLLAKERGRRIWGWKQSAGGRREEANDASSDSSAGTHNKNKKTKKVNVVSFIA